MQLKLLGLLTGLGFLISVKAVYLLVEDSLNSKHLYSFLLAGPCIPCEKFNETLYDYKGAPKPAKDSVLSRLKCHHSSYNNGNYYFIKTTDTRRCRALNPIDGKIYVVRCNLPFPSLCTNSGEERTLNTPASTDEKLSYTVNTTFGDITGTRSDLCFLFLGIPYALPPVGKLRFEPPKRISKLDSTWNATFYRGFCPQDASFAFFPNINEDCLYLNVYTPYVPDSGDNDSPLLPVMVWIHGGAYVRGGSHHLYHDPSHLVSHEGVVVVTINYRLGALGFWGCGNQAIKDQITALQWVREFISFFGGDPLRVTIAGESAGASSVRALVLAKSKTDGLFQAAALMSDPISMGFATKEDSIDLLSMTLASYAGCIHGEFNISDPKLMECLRQLPLEELLLYQALIFASIFLYADSISMGEIYKPCIDGDLFTEDLFDSIYTGNFVRVPLMLGFVKHEAAFFLESFPEFLETNFFVNLTLSSYFSPGQVDQILRNDYYSKNLNYSDIRNSKDFVSHVFTDAVWVCPSILTAARISDYVDVFLYQYEYPFMWAHPPSSICYGLVCHADDLAAFLGSIFMKGIQATYDSDGEIVESDIIFTRLVLARLGSFLKTYNPNPDPDKLCYNKEFFKVGDCNRRTVGWSRYKPNSSLDDAPSFFNDTTNGKVYGPVHILNLTESTSGDYFLPRDVCDFWFKLGIHAQLYSSKKRISKTS